MANLSESSLSNLSSCSCEINHDVDDNAPIEELTESTKNLLMQSLSQFKYEDDQAPQSSQLVQFGDEDEQFGYFLPLSSLHLTPVFLKR